MKEIMAINWHARIGRMDYLKGMVGAVGLVIVSVLIIGVGTEVFSTNELIGRCIGSLLMGLGLIPLVYSILLKLSLLARRFRDMGIEDSGAVTGVVLVFLICNSFFPPVALVPLFWPGKKDESITA
jgi:uncharacterized membrane protein YhaH (DUF805 family)